MAKKIVLSVAVAAFAVIAMAPSASASCNPGKSASTYVGGASAYWLPATVQGNAIGQTWQLGAPGTWNGAGGAVPCSPGIVYFSAAGMNLNLDLGACGAGCPNGPLAVLAQNETPTGTEFLLATVVETPANSVNFDYQAGGNRNLIKIPRPRVLSSSRSGTDVILSIALDSIAGGLYGPNAGSAVTGYRLLGKSASSDPGAAASGYDAVARAVVAAPGGIAATTPLTVNCSDLANDQFLAVQISFEGGAVLSNSVSAATRVRCDPALANPKTPKVKVAPKKGVATN